MVYYGDQRGRDKPGYIKIHSEYVGNINGGVMDEPNIFRVHQSNSKTQI